MKNKKFPFNLLAGFCPPSAADHLGIVGDESDNDSNYGVHVPVNAKGAMPSSLVEDDSATRQKVAVEPLKISRTVPIDDATPILNAESERQKSLENTTTPTNESVPATTDSITACESMDKEPPSVVSQKDITAENSSNQTILRSLAILSTLLLSCFVIFYRSNNGEFYRGILGDNGGVHRNAKVSDASAKAQSKSLPESHDTNTHKMDEKSQTMESSAETIEFDAQSPSSTLPNDDDIEQPEFAGDASSMSPEEHDDDGGSLAEAQHSNATVDNDNETEEQHESTRSGSDIHEEDSPGPDGKIQFFKLETDERGPYLVSCEKSLQNDGTDTPPPIVCSETK